jgi:DNA-binding response OmpR family regulator
VVQRILIVEDDLDTVTLLKWAFVRTDFELDVARNGREALQKARELRCDLILMDLLLPDMDGLEACRQLHADPALADVRVVMLSSCRDIRERLAAREAGALDYWTKPFSPRELVEKVRHLLKPKGTTPTAA